MKASTHLIALVCALIHSAVFAASGQDLLADTIKREKELRSRGDDVTKSEYSALIEAYSNALASGDLSTADRLRALVNRGRLYVQTGECTLAVKDLDAGIQGGSRDAAAYAARAYCRAQAGSLKGAREDLDAAISITPKEANLYRERAIVFTDLKMYAEAVNDLSRSIDLIKPARSSDLHVMRGDAHLARGEYERAIEDYGRAIQITKDNAEKIFKTKLSPRSSSLRPLYEKLSEAYRLLARASDSTR